MNTTPGSIDKAKHGKSIFMVDHLGWIHTFYHDKTTNHWKRAALTETWNTTEICKGKIKYLDNQKVLSYIGNSNQIHYYKYLTHWTHHIESNMTSNAASNLAYGGGAFLYYHNTSIQAYSIALTLCEQNHNLCPHDSAYVVINPMGAKTLTPSDFLDEDPVEIESQQIEDEYQENNANTINIYPNPANENINIQRSSNKPITIKVFNTLGQEVYNIVKTTSSEETIDIKNWRPGIFYIHIDDSTLEQQIYKVVKMK